MSSVGHEHMRRLMVSWLFTMIPWENLRSWGVSWTHDKISKLRASHGSHDITKRSLSSSCDCVLIHPTPTMRASHGSHGDPTWPWGVSWALGQIFKVAPPTPTMRASHGSHGDPIRPWGVSWTHGQIIFKKAPSTPTMRAFHGSHGDPTRPCGVSWALGQIIIKKDGSSRNGKIFANLLVYLFFLQDYCKIFARMKENRK